MNEHLQKGISLYKKKKYKEALVELLGFTAKDDEEHLEQAYYTGLCYKRLNRYEDALIYLEQVVTGGSDIARLYQCRLILALIYSQTNRLRMAEFELNKLRTAGYESVQVFSSIGFLAYEQEDVKKAIEFYEQALSLDPKNANAQNGLGYVLADTEKDTARALELCKKAVAQNSENAAYLDSLGWAYFKTGSMTEARLYLSRALEKLPRHPLIKKHFKIAFSTEKGEKK